MSRRTLLAYGAFVLLAALLLVSFVFDETLPNPNISPKLSTQCPPGFKRNDKNECMAINLYQQYDSPNDQGIGGMTTNLPQVRDGFSPQQIDLGRFLFFDPILSGDGTMSCASCHHPDKGFSDNLPTSKGHKGRHLNRAAPSLWNVAYLERFFWDGRATSLEEQMKGPLFSKEEMNNTPNHLLFTINKSTPYRRLFAEAFSYKKDRVTITLEEIYTALAGFQASLISLNSRYDQYAHGYHAALTPTEIEGLNVFRSFVARCAECHTPPLFTNQQFAVIGSPEPHGKPLDPGAQITFKDSTLRGAFKVPSLRNIEKTAPYMHSGRFENLRETVQFYTDGRGHAVPDNEQLILHWHIWDPHLSDNELDRLVDFLKTLTDESFKPIVPKVLPSGLKPTI